MTLASLFTHPIELMPSVALWLVLPLSFSVAATYKIIRTQRPRRLPLEILGAFAYILGGLLGVGALLWLVQAYWP